MPLSARDSGYIHAARGSMAASASLHRASAAVKYAHSPITANAPVWGSFRISSFFSRSPQELRASMVSA